jgi:serine/threonine-protein kinase
MQPPSLVNHTLGKYRIQAELGRGGMAVVYRGYDPALDRLVAVKVLAPHLVWQEGFVERFLREARSAARLNHPNIVTIHDVGQEAGGYYFVMEHVEGVPLDHLIQEHGVFAAEDVLYITQALASALDYAHARALVHRDIKPGNVIVAVDHRVVLTDFGIAYAAQEQRMTSTGTILGTPEYMAPEQARGESADARSDLYSLAIITYQMLSGQVPFKADSTLALLYKVVNEPLPPIRQVRPELPEAVEQVLSKALAKAPAERFASAGDFYAALREIFRAQVVEVPASLSFAPHHVSTAEPSLDNGAETSTSAAQATVVAESSEALSSPAAAQATVIAESSEALSPSAAAQATVIAESSEVLSSPAAAQTTVVAEPEPEPPAAPAVTPSTVSQAAPPVKPAKRRKLLWIVGMLVLLAGGLWMGRGRIVNLVAPVPTATLTLTPRPTATPRRTATPRPTSKSISISPPTSTATLTPTPFGVRPILLSPGDSELVRQTIVYFNWQGQLGEGQRYRVHLRHVESQRTVECVMASATTCMAELPGELFGEWRWAVGVVPNGLYSGERVFWFKPF